jgi:hypothetical protein
LAPLFSESHALLRGQMSELRKGGGGGFPSEASRMLEAALEQMDGIIQGAKYELPHQFDNIAIQVTCRSVVADPVFLSRILDTMFSIPDPGSKRFQIRIKEFNYL